MALADEYSRYWYGGRGGPVGDVAPLSLEPLQQCGEGFLDLLLACQFVEVRHAGFGQE
jgi:hypothetical protein